MRSLSFTFICRDSQRQKVISKSFYFLVRNAIIRYFTRQLWPDQILIFLTLGRYKSLNFSSIEKSIEISEYIPESLFASSSFCVAKFTFLQHKSALFVWKKWFLALFLKMWLEITFSIQKVISSHILKMWLEITFSTQKVISSHILKTWLEITFSIQKVIFSHIFENVARNHFFHTKSNF